MAQKTIAGFTTTYNCFEMHYPFLQCIESLLGFCDEVSIVDAGSNDGTIEAIQALQKRESRIKFEVKPVDFSHPRWAIYQDGYLKAKARDNCTADYCWQTDTDEIVAEHDYQKIRDLPDIIGNTSLIMLPMIEFWGSLKTIRADFFSWKPRFSINDKRITHGIPRELRCYDVSGHEYPRPFDSDSCNYIYRDTLESVPITIPVENRLLTSLSLGTEEYKQYFFKWLENYPAVYHVSWLDLRRKVTHYKKLWRRFHASMYDLALEDTAANNVMFDKPWAEVTEKDIRDKASELERLGPRFFHKKMDRERKGYVFDFNRPLPPALVSWYENELREYRELDSRVEVNSAPLVSAVVPFRGQAKSLKEAVASLETQSYPNLEIILVHEEGSQAEDLAGIVSHSSRAINLVTKKKGTLSDSKNVGVRQSRGTYVLVLEEEDLLSRDYIGQGVQLLKANDANLFYSAVQYAGAKQGVWTPDAYDEYKLRYENTIPKSAIFSKAIWSIAGGFKEVLPFSEDWDFYLNCAKSGLRPAFSREALLTDRVSDNEACLNAVESAFIKAANPELYAVDEILSEHDRLSQNLDSWFTYCEKLSDLKPDNWLLQMARGIGHQAQGRSAEAMQFYGFSIHNSQYKNWQPIYRLALLLQTMKRDKEARELMHSARSLRPDLNRLVRDYLK